MARKRGAGNDIPGLGCFSLNGENGALEHVKRSRFEPNRRKEVADVRAKGACFRCQLMRLSCSGDRPCERCVIMAQSRHASSFTWMSCVPSAFAPLKNFFKFVVNIPENAADFTISPVKANSLIASQPIVLDFENHIKWDINDLSRGWAHCMSHKADLAQTSAVGVMSSLQLQNLLSTWIPDIACIEFRLLIYISSLLYNFRFKETIIGYTWFELYTMRSQTGNALLENLEKLLRLSDLAKASPEKLKALFLILFGTILAVGYTGSIVGNAYLQPFSQEASQSATNEELDQLQKQLIRVLVHRMIDIGDRLKLLDGSVSRALLVESAQQKWDLPAAFTWTLKSTKVSILGGNESFRTALTPDQRAQAAEIIMFHSCGGSRGCIRIGRRTGIKTGSRTGSTTGRPCQILCCEEIGIGRSSFRVSVINQQWLRGPEKPQSSFRSPPRCRNCDFFITEDMRDGLCYSCTGLNVGNFDQTSDWLQLSGFDYQSEHLNFNSQPAPTCDMGVYGDAASSPFVSTPLISDNFTSDFSVDYIEDATARIALPAMDCPPFLNDLGLDERNTMLQYRDNSGCVDDHAHPTDIFEGYLV